MSSDQAYTFRRYKKREHLEVAEHEVDAILCNEISVFCRV